MIVIWILTSAYYLVKQVLGKECVFYSNPLHKTHILCIEGLEYTHININTLVNHFSDATILTICNTSVSTLPVGIGQLSSLRHLQLNNNKLINLPEDLYKLSLLVSVDLGYNNLTILPRDYKNMKSVKILQLNNNCLSQPIIGISNMVNLEKLNLSDNLLESLPNEIEKLSKSLIVINLNKNPIKYYSSTDTFGYLTLKTIFFGRICIDVVVDVPGIANFTVDSVYKRLNMEDVRWNLEKLRTLVEKPVPRSTLSKEEILDIYDTEIRNKVQNIEEFLRFRSFIGVAFTPDKKTKPEFLENCLIRLKDVTEAIVRALILEQSCLKINFCITFLSNSLLHCLDRRLQTLGVCYYTFLNGRPDPDSCLEAFINNFITIQKSSVLMNIVCNVNYIHNVHHYNYWAYELREEIGFDVDYKTGYGTYGQDLFFGNKAVVLDAFFAAFSPKKIVEMLTTEINSNQVKCNDILHFISQSTTNTDLQSTMFEGSDILFASKVTTQGVEHYLREKGYIECSSNNRTRNRLY